MNRAEQLRAVFVLGPIIGLLLVGTWLSLRSGIARLSSEKGLRRLAENLTQTILMIGASLLVLFVVQEFVGYQMTLPWE